MRPELFRDNFCKNNVWVRVEYKEGGKWRKEDMRLYKPTKMAVHWVFAGMDGVRKAMPINYIRDITKVFYIKNFRLR